MILKFGMKHQDEELYKVCINHDLGMTLTSQSQTLCGASLGMKIYINGQGHMTKVATMAINSKNPFKNSSSSGPKGL